MCSFLKMTFRVYLDDVIQRGNVKLQVHYAARVSLKERREQHRAGVGGMEF